MLFPTLQFAVFFLVVYPLSWLLRTRDRVWKFLVLVASYCFYGAWDWRFVGLIALSTVVNTALARPIASGTHRVRRGALVIALVFNLGLLGTFKYYGFFIEQLNGLLRVLGLPAALPFLEVIIPVGISFFTFQAISYTIDLYRRGLTPVPLLDFAVYLSFFPHLVAGPIVRASEFVPQIWPPRPLTRPDAARAFLLIAGGFFKKVVISSYVATTIVDPVFAVPSQRAALEILLGIYGYAVQIYADFSGYTDLAIGIALLMGIRFPQNFDRPYRATSLQDFWRRWHMTLSRWLRDYLFIPLGGSRHGTVATYRNLLLTMTLGGLWHGAAWTFIIWGLFHGLGLAVERLVGELRGQRPRARSAPMTRPPARWRLGISWLVTFHLVCVGWVFFRADSVTTAGEIFVRVATAWGPAPLVSLGLVAVIAGTLALQLLPDNVGERLEGGLGRLPLPVQGALLGVWLALAIVLGPTGVAPFIYYQF